MYQLFIICLIFSFGFIHPSASRNEFFLKYLRDLVDPKFKEEGEKLIFSVICWKTPEAIDRLVELMNSLPRDKGNINVRNEVGQTALHVACNQNLYIAVKSLLKHGINISLEDKNGNTALRTAVMRGFVKIVQILWENGASQEIKTEEDKKILCSWIERIRDKNNKETMKIFFQKVFSSFSHFIANNRANRSKIL